APKGVRLRAGIADQLGATDGTLEAMAIIMDDGSVLPDVAYLTSAQLGRPFPVRWVPVADRDGQKASVRKQFTTEITRGNKYDGVVLDGPDNVTVTPWGTLVLAEDGVGASHVLSSVPGGPTYAIARNMLNIGSDAAPEYSEFTGPTFAPDGSVLFVNIQTPGI